MGEWGDPQFIAQASGARKTLEAAVQALNSKTKQAFYAAAKSQVIHQGTWNGCAFNAAGKVVGDENVSSYSKAAEVFELPVQKVQDFITAWDSFQASGEYEATNKLLEILDKVGLFTEPNTGKPKRYGFRVYTSWETRMKEELDGIIAENPDLVDGSCEARELLSV